MKRISLTVVAIATTTLMAACGSTGSQAQTSTLAPAIADQPGEPGSAPTPAGTPAKGGGSPVDLVFATFNVCKTDCAPPAPPWEVRRDRVARVIGGSGADVIGLQEATNQPTATAKTQVEDIQVNLAGPQGYAAPTFPIENNDCRRPRDAAGQLTGPSPCENTSALLFRAASIKQVSVPSGMPSAGITQYGMIVPGSDPAASSRSVAWAYLQPVAGGVPFLAIALHTDNGKNPVAEQSRVSLAGALGPWVDTLNARAGLPGTPAILMADLNSYKKRQPNGVQKQLVDNGWIDAFKAEELSNIEYSTINYNPALPDGKGFPVKPYKFRLAKKREATRIDYIMGYGTNITPLTYEVMLYLNADGTFNPDYQASDHQMVRATFQVGS